MRNLTRIVRHLLMTPWQVRRVLPGLAMDAIERAVRDSEQWHFGQIQVVVEGALPAELLWRNVSARQRAIDIFSTLRIWDTENNNGVLLYLLLADRDVEIIADRGIAKRVPQAEWEAICKQMESAFRSGNFQDGILTGVKSIAAKLTAHFPASGSGRNELPDRPLVL